MTTNSVGLLGGALSRTLRAFVGAAAVASVLASVVGTAKADDKRELAYSFNLGITSDYIFRGFSQTGRSPTGQGGVDLTYGIFYAGVWASGLDFGYSAMTNKHIARAELDVYAGFKPVVGPVTFDLGVIGYTYPGSTKDLGELNYLELKAGASVAPWKGGTVGATVYFSPEYTGNTGRVWTLEGSVAHEFGKLGSITPTFSALVGYQAGDNAAYRVAFGNGSSDYAYWNAGMTFGWEKFSLDLRYWDTNVSRASGFCNGATFQCSERFMGTLKFTY